MKNNNEVLLIDDQEVVTPGHAKVPHGPGIAVINDKRILSVDAEEVVVPGMPGVLQGPGVLVDNNEVLPIDDKEAVTRSLGKVLRVAGIPLKKGKRILLVDDEEVISFGFSKVLGEPGVEVDCAQTLEEAQNFIAAHNYDAAIVDLRLSSSTEMEGFDCIRLLRSRRSTCKIIVITAYGGNGFKDQAIALGADLFFEKPIEPEKIRETLKTFGIYDD